MRKLIFRNGTGLPEYPPDHLRLIELRTGEDELEAVQRYMSGDPTLNNYLGLVNVDDAFLRKRHLGVNGTIDPSSFGLVTKRRSNVRNCWRWAVGTITVDMAILRSNYLNVLRTERSARLDASDRKKALLDDLGTPEQIAAHKFYRQQLRDLPAVVQADLSALTTAEQIEQYQPAWPVEPS